MTTKGVRFTVGDYVIITSGEEIDTHGVVIVADDAKSMGGIYKVYFRNPKQPYYIGWYFENEIRLLRDDEMLDKDAPK